MPKITIQKILTFSILFITFLTTLSFSATAQNNQDFDLIQDIESNLEGEREEMERISGLQNPEINPDAIQDCQEIKINLEIALELYSTNRASFVARYDSINKKTDSLKKTLAEEKQENDELTKITQEFQSLTKDFADLSQEFIQTLESSKEYVCAKPEDEFLKKREQFQTKIEEVNEKAGKIRTFMKEDFQPVILKL